MTPKEKAKELVDRFKKLDTTFDGVDVLCHEAKQCALICVNQMESFYKDIMRIGTSKQMLYYFNEIRKEIQKL